MIDWNDNSNDVNRVYLAHYLLSLHVTTACINASPHPPRHAYLGKVNKVHVETYINRYISVYCGVDAITSTLSTVQMYRCTAMYICTCRRFDLKIVYLSKNHVRREWNLVRCLWQRYFLWDVRANSLSHLNRTCTNSNTA